MAIGIAEEEGVSDGVEGGRGLGEEKGEGEGRLESQVVRPPS